MYNKKYNRNPNEQEKKNDDIIDDIYKKSLNINKNAYCNNCNKKGHNFKKCNNPIISNGIIALYIENIDVNIIPTLQKYIYEKINNKNDNNDNNEYKNNDYKKIKFLMVQRKHSLGYIEFIRGKYDVDNLEKIKKIFEQMTPNEIKDINEYNFDYLWNMLWDNNPYSTTTIKNKFHYKEYITSKQKFYDLKMQNIDLFSEVKPNFVSNEWGFPKGRREVYESDIVCAMREFKEETFFNENDYVILDEKHSIKENLVGTNGINYRHNYYLAFLQNKEIKNIENKEIGDIKLMDIDECLEKIRPYHKNKIKIIKNVYDAIINILENHYLVEPQK